MAVESAAGKAGFIGKEAMSDLRYPDIAQSESFADAFAGRYQAQPRTIEDLGQGRSRLSMRASAPDGTHCLKTVTVDPHPAPGTKSVTAEYQLDTPRGSLAMDGTQLTEMRTAACALRAAMGLTRNPQRALIVGTGSLAPEFVRAYAEGLPSLKRIAIWGRDADKSRNVVHQGQDVANRNGLALAAVPPGGLRAEVAEADVVATITSATEPVIKADFTIKPGAHLGLIGGWQLEHREVAPTHLRGATVYVDTPEAIEKSSEIQDAMAMGIVSRADIKSLADLPAPGTASGTSVYKSVGNATLDLAMGKFIESSRGQA